MALSGSIAGGDGGGDSVRGGEVDEGESREESEGDEVEGEGSRSFFIVAIGLPAGHDTIPWLRQRITSAIGLKLITLVPPLAKGSPPWHGHQATGACGSGPVVFAGAHATSPGAQLTKPRSASFGCAYHSSSHASEATT